MKSIYVLEVNPPKAANAAKKGKTVMATKALTKYQKHVKDYAKAHPKSKNVIAAAAKTWRGSSRPAAKKAKSAARKATSAVTKAKKRTVGYDSSKVRLVKVKKGPHAGGRHGTPIGRGLFRLSRNPGDFVDRLKKAFSTETAGMVIGAGAGGVAAVLLPTLIGTQNEGWKGVGLSALATALAAGGAAFIFPAAVIPVAAGGIAITFIRALIVGVPAALGWFMKPLLVWSGATPAGDGSAKGWQERGRQAGFQEAGGRLAGTPPNEETFGNTPVDSF